MDTEILVIHNALLALSKNLDVEKSEVQEIVNEKINFPENSSHRDVWFEYAKICANRNEKSPDWSLLGGRILTKWVERQNPYTFSEFSRLGMGEKGLKRDYVDYILENGEELDKLSEIHLYDFDYASMSTLIRSYLYKIKFNGEYIIETLPQLYLRVSCFLHYPNFVSIKELYDILCSKKAAFSSPVYFNSATFKPALQACYLGHITDDLEGISTSWKEAALISKHKGGLGMDFSSLRHSEIGSTGGVSRGIIPWIKIQNEVMNAVDQSSVRNGSATDFLRDFHIDIEEFMELRKPLGAEDMRARNIFLAVGLSDLFYKRLENDGIWSLFCPNRCPGLADAYGHKFETLYKEYEEKKMYSRQVSARSLYRKLYLLRIETGMPFVLNVDNTNYKNMQDNIGIIRQSNLCMEIVEHTSKDELASCILGSVCYPSHIKTLPDGSKEFDFLALERTVRIMIRSLNQVTDRTYYPPEIPKIKYTNFKNRPVALGIQGLADTFAILDLCWEDEEARILNYRLHERQYYASVRESCELAKMYGPYPAFEGSPYSKGLLHTDLCDMEGKNIAPKHYGLIEEAKWKDLREQVKQIGVRNSLVIARMPTATSAYLVGNNESFEPFYHLIYTRAVLSGKFTFVNRHLYNDIKRLCPEAWNTETIKTIILSGGSIQNISIPGKEKIETFLKKKYLNSFELPQRLILQHSIDVLRFIDQSSSLNAHFDNPTFEKVYSWDMKAWKGGLKTGMYYLRRLPRDNAINFALHEKKESTTTSEQEEKIMNRIVCTDEICTSCSV